MDAPDQGIGHKKGQETDGTFTMGVGKVVNGDLDDVYAKWLEAMANTAELKGLSVLSQKQSDSEKWRYWRAELADGTRSVATIHQSKPGKVGLAVDQKKCPTEAEAIEWKTFWREFVDNLFVNK